MPLWDLGVDFAEFRYAVTDRFSSKPATPVFNILFECQFGPGEKADGYVLLIDVSKTTSLGATKVGGAECFADLGRTRCDCVSGSALLPERSAMAKVVIWPER